MDEASHFDQVSRFGPSAIIMVMVIAGSFVITAIHTYQELKGAGAPHGEISVPLLALNCLISSDSWHFPCF